MEMYSRPPQDSSLFPEHGATQKSAEATNEPGGLMISLPQSDFQVIIFRSNTAESKPTAIRTSWTLRPGIQPIVL
jgi:hypothetical protein